MTTNAFIYRASLLREACGLARRARIDAAGKAPADPGNEYSYDSSEYPKGPYPDGGGEADSPQHCDDCQAFLGNPLTEYGYQYVRDAIEESRSRNSVAIAEWAPFYGIPVTVVRP